MLSGIMCVDPHGTTKKTLALPDGSFVVLMEMANDCRDLPECEVIHNVYRIAPDGRVLWQISAPPPVRPGTPFTNIYFTDGRLRAFRFDCYEHDVDLETGESVIHDFLK